MKRFVLIALVTFPSVATAQITPLWYEDAPTYGHESLSDKLDRMERNNKAAIWNQELERSRQDSDEFSRQLNAPSSLSKTLDSLQRQYDRENAREELKQEILDELEAETSSFDD